MTRLVSPTFRSLLVVVSTTLSLSRANGLDARGSDVHGTLASCAALSVSDLAAGRRECGGGTRARPNGGEMPRTHVSGVTNARELHPSSTPLGSQIDSLALVKGTVAISALAVQCAGPFHCSIANSGTQPNPHLSLRARFHSASACVSVMMPDTVATRTALTCSVTAVSRACCAASCRSARPWAT